MPFFRRTYHYVLTVAVHLTALQFAKCARVKFDQRAELGLNLDVTEEAVAAVCTPQTVHGACRVLEDAPARTLGEKLALTEQQTAELLATLDLPRDGFSCQELCDAALARIPRILGKALPKIANQGCLDDECTKQLNVDPGSLKSTGMKTFQHPEESDEGGANTLNQTASPHVVTLENTFRRLLSIVLRAFPAHNDGFEDEPEKPESEALLEDGVVLDGPGLIYGPRIRDDRKGQYKEYNMMAQAWISEAIRKLDHGRNHVKKWFNIRDSEVNRQIREARHHLTMMLDLFGHSMFKKGVERCKLTETPTGKSGTLAFVMTSGNCKLTDYVDCGEKIDGRYVINFCEFYWDHRIASSERIGTVVHESSHHFGTNDNGYCSMVDCPSLPSDKARNNADSYAELVKALVEDDTLAADGEPERPPCKDSASTGFTSGEGAPITCANACQYGLTCKDQNIQDRCPVTCGTCPGSTGGPRCFDCPTPGQSSTGQPFTCAQACKFGLTCKDKSMQEKCPETCGTCPGSTTAPRCFDCPAGTGFTSGGKDISCSDMKRYSISCSQVGDKCPESCGRCPGAGQSVPAAPTQCEDTNLPFTDQTTGAPVTCEMGCKYGLTCDSSKEMRDSCPVFCGTCPGKKTKPVCSDCPAGTGFTSRAGAIMCKDMSSYSGVSCRGDVANRCRKTCGLCS